MKIGNAHKYESKVWLDIQQCGSEDQHAIRLRKNKQVDQQEDHERTSSAYGCPTAIHFYIFLYFIKGGAYQL